MLVLFELAAGYTIFNVNDEGVIKDPDAAWKIFESEKSIKQKQAIFF